MSPGRRAVTVVSGWRFGAAPGVQRENYWWSVRIPNVRYSSAAQPLRELRLQ
jgi:hypothetical protein